MNDMFESDLTRQEIAAWAWLAGLIDGEGWIGLSQPHEHSLGQIFLRIIMTSQKTVERIKEISHVGSIRQLPPQKSHHKTAYSWQAESREAAGVLRRCLPFLVTKKSQAELALEDAEITRLQPRGLTVPFGLRARREKLRESMRQLNAKGRGDGSGPER